ncbi:hypothetical protein RF11_08008 [Thelohanellus kitauei]|uniref:Uncharacterized protein n=1 Tax=Thelohanellus kitauei TaxID=669202 RepID=A0A0C2IJM0_THEKT|nr:hypothetical protein RF11_08008 [Thelohanellus kitauei]
MLTETTRRNPKYAVGLPSKRAVSNLWYQARGIASISTLDIRHPLLLVPLKVGLFSKEVVGKILEQELIIFKCYSSRINEKLAHLHPDIQKFVGVLKKEKSNCTSLSRDIRSGAIKQGLVPTLEKLLKN